MRGGGGVPQKLGKGSASFPVVHTADKGWFNLPTRWPFSDLDWSFQDWQAADTRSLEVEGLMARVG